ncbi:hypothetical protein WMF41_04530 [Sorangium sp. So ce1151]
MDAPLPQPVRFPLPPSKFAPEDGPFSVDAVQSPAMPKAWASPAPPAVLLSPRGITSFDFQGSSGA